LDNYIENYCGTWRNKSGNRIEISLDQHDRVKVNFYRAGENFPFLRPWVQGRPAQGMLGTLDPEGGSLNISLSDGENSFCLNLYFDVYYDSYQRLEPSIIRYAAEDFLEKYYLSIGTLETYEKC
jgi:hypothetical protein